MLVLILSVSICAVFADVLEVPMDDSGELVRQLVSRVEMLEARDRRIELENQELVARMEMLEARDRRIELENQDLVARVEMLEARDRRIELENQELVARVHQLETLSELQQDEIGSQKNYMKSQQNLNNQLQAKIHRLETFLMADREPKSDEEHDHDVPVAHKPISQEHFHRTLQKIQHPVMNIKRGVSARRSNEVNVAFHACLVNHIETPGVHQLIAFEKVITNIGNGYNPHAGDFRAPVAGTYVFSTSIMAGHEGIGDHYHYQVMRNGTSVANIYIVSGGMGSQEVVLQLNQWDDVAVHNLDPGKKVYGSCYSTFSGFLLQEDFSSPSVIGK